MELELFANAIVPGPLSRSVGVLKTVETPAGGHRVPQPIDAFLKAVVSEPTFEWALDAIFLYDGLVTQKEGGQYGLWHVSRQDSSVAQLHLLRVTIGQHQAKRMGITPDPEQPSVLRLDAHPDAIRHLNPGLAIGPAINRGTSLEAFLVETDGPEVEGAAAEEVDEDAEQQDERDEDAGCACHSNTDASDYDREGNPVNGGHYHSENDLYTLYELGIPVQAFVPPTQEEIEDAQTGGDPVSELEGRFEDVGPGEWRHDDKHRLRPLEFYFPKSLDGKELLYNAPGSGPRVGTFLYSNHYRGWFIEELTQSSIPITVDDLDGSDGFCIYTEDNEVVTLHHYLPATPAE
jgi:hypothetical protein